MKNTNCILEQMEKDFAEMVNHDLNGQNWDCTIIPDVGNGKGGTAIAGPGEQTRCECFSKGGREEKPQFRTPLDTPINQGDVVFIPAQDMFYLLEHQPQKDVNCYSTKATPCNARITISRHYDDVTDPKGFLIEAGGTSDYIVNVPCVSKPHPSLAYANGMPGAIIEDELTVILQRNAYTEQIQRGHTFTLDGKAYTIYDLHTDGNPQTCKGIIILHCRAITGSAEG